MKERIQQRSNTKLIKNLFMDESIMDLIIVHGNVPVKNGLFMDEIYLEDVIDVNLQDFIPRQKGG
jgi:hypothetical protein